MSGESLLNPTVSQRCFSSKPLLSGQCGAEAFLLVASIRSSEILVAILLKVSLTLGTSLLAQTASTGTLIGVVLDVSGKGIPQALIEAKNQERVLTRSCSPGTCAHIQMPISASGSRLPVRGGAINDFCAAGLTGSQKPNDINSSIPLSPEQIGERFAGAASAIP